MTWASQQGFKTLHMSWALNFMHEIGKVISILLSILLAPCIDNVVYSLGERWQTAGGNRGSIQAEPRETKAWLNSL